MEAVIFSNPNHSATAPNLRRTSNKPGTPGSPNTAHAESAEQHPALHSNPSASDALYLDFDGHFEPVWGSYSNLTTPSYDVDGDTSTFTDGELANIGTIWAAVAEDYAPFNLDVTTVRPAVLARACRSITPMASL